MKKNRLKCETCQFSGYSPDFCKFHQKKIIKVNVENCFPQDFYKKIGKKAVLGAGIGVVAVTAGLAVVPTVGLKAVIGHALGAKLTAGGGAACAGINVARPTKKNQPESKRGRKKGVFFPLYLKKRS
jgi:hypothetical protein